MNFCKNNRFICEPELIQLLGKSPGMTTGMVFQLRFLGKGYC